jgi:hypothetical protein
MRTTPPARSRNASTSVWLPALVLLGIMLAYLGQILVRSGGDPLVFAHLGTKYTHGSIRGSEGYDGQFNYYIAMDPSPHSVAPRLDAPAYRYQRILVPLIARAAAFANPHAIPWTLVALNLAYHIAAVMILAKMLLRRSGPTWAALLFGLWVGLVAGVRLDLTEPLALLLVLLALWSEEQLADRAHESIWRARAADWIPGLLLAASLLAKETVLPFAVGWAFLPVLEKGWGRAAARLLVFLPFAVLQAWLWMTFGTTGLISGGAGSTSFEILPLAGLLHIGQFSPKAFAVIALVLLPGVILPALLAVWGGVQALKTLRTRRTAVFLLLNSVMVLVAPFSTFREPLGITRLASGMIVCVLLFAAETRRPRVYSWGLLWLSYLALLVE